jgi:mannose-6-phosphate isomerase
MTLEADAMDAALAAALAHADGPGKETPEGRWMRQLAEAYPGDPGILSPLFLNLILLEPGEALFLPAGELHAYLDGVGVEIMANSDNVLRGGLTPKHVDVPELMARVRFSPRRPPVLKPVAVSAVEAVYDTPADEFRLTEIQPGESPSELDVQSVEILLGMADGPRLRVPATGQELKLGRGETLLVPAAVGRYAVSGAGRFFRASVPVGE